MPSVLQNLLGRDDCRFHVPVWPEAAEVFRAERGWFEELAALDVFTDVEQWLDRAPELSSFRTPGPLPRGEARRRYVAGESIYILGLHRVVKRLQELCNGIADEVGVARSHISVEAWAAGGPTAVAMHYDHDFNFNIQLSGRKQWRTARNTSVAEPLRSHHPLVDANPSDPWAATVAVPEETQDWEVEPGQVVYLPRGTWHATTTDEPTVAMAFVLKPPTWAQHVGQTVVDRLHGDVRWRRRVLGARNPAHESTLHRDAEAAVAEAVQQLGSVGAAELLARSAADTAGAIFRVGPGIEDLAWRDDGLAITWSQNGSRLDFEIPAWARAAAELMVASPEGWSRGTLEDRVTVADRPFLDLLIHKLLERGVFQPVLV